MGSEARRADVASMQSQPGPAGDNPVEWSFSPN